MRLRRVPPSKIGTLKLSNALPPARSMVE